MQNFDVNGKKRKMESKTANVLTQIPPNQKMRKRLQSAFALMCDDENTRALIYNIVMEQVTANGNGFPPIIMEFIAKLNSIINEPTLQSDVDTDVESNVIDNDGRSNCLFNKSHNVRRLHDNDDLNNVLDLSVCILS